MGFFGLTALKDEKALELLREYQPIIIESVNAFMLLDGLKRERVSGDSPSGYDILWNRIKEAEVEIESYMSKEYPNLRRDYIYGDPYVFVTCAIYNKYTKGCASKEKVEYSSNIEKLKKTFIPKDRNGNIDDLKLNMDFIPEIIRGFCRVYFDNISNTLKKAYKSVGTVNIDRKSDKEKSIKYLSQILEFAPTIYGVDAVNKQLELSQRRVQEAIFKKQAAIQRVREKNWRD